MACKQGKSSLLRGPILKPQGFTNIYDCFKKAPKLMKTFKAQFEMEKAKFMHHLTWLNATNAPVTTHLVVQ
eukprot:14023593-Ditylum_brightwellii.AAC.1